MITVLGAGSIGSTIAADLSQDYEISVVDKKKAALDNVPVKRRYLGRIFDYPELIDQSEIIVCALPGSVSYSIVSKLLSYGKKIVDVSYMPEDPFALDGEAKDKKSLLVPDAGYAPGLTNILAGNLYKAKKYKSIEIYSGGLPQEKIPPLDYIITWSVEGLIDEYTRPARIVKKGLIESVDPLESIVEHSEFPELGVLESFYSDGLRTLLKTMPNVDMFERTFRYPGHLQKIKFLREMGYFSSEEINGCNPRKMTEKIFENLRVPAKDLSILLVRGIGKEIKEFLHIDRFDESTNTTSMARMTGYTAAVITRAVANGHIDGTGIVPPEYIGMDDSAFSFVLKELEKRGISILK